MLCLESCFNDYCGFTKSKTDYMASFNMTKGSEIISETALILNTLHFVLYSFPPPTSVKSLRIILKSVEKYPKWDTFNLLTSPQIYFALNNGTYHPLMDAISFQSAAYV